MVWCVETEKYLEFKKERVCTFLARNNIGIATHVILKIQLKKGSYVSDEILHLSSQLDPETGCKYILTRPECTLYIYINLYAQSFLKSEKRKIVFLAANKLSVHHVLKSLEKYFPVFPYFSEFALYYRVRTPESTFLKKAEMHESASDAGPVLYLQPSHPLNLSRKFPAQFSSEFYQLKAINSSMVFAKKYIVGVFGHFLFAYKKGTDGALGYTLEITSDLVSYKQTVGTKVFAVIEHNGMRWSLYNKSTEAVESLLYCVSHAPRSLPRDTDIDTEVDEEWGQKCDAVREIVSYNISSSSFPQAAVLFPQSIPRIKDEVTESQSPQALVQKLQSHIQRSIWDNVNIEFLVYLLNMQGLPLALEIHEEIREYSMHRKRILKKIKEIEKSL
ncbi:hypothetical protein NEAUS03_0800 [Nematocida ausubeli]|nr:hypothetical protein NEAUS03_0800 [Nematocida ausubeli]